VIKFFRNIRKTLLAEGKSLKYLKYAIGEIVLVVIGILIALQVNTWNEQNKTKIKEHQDLVKLKEEFDYNYEMLDYVLGTKKKSLDAWKTWIMKIVNKEYSDLKSLKRLDASATTFIPIVSTYEKLIYTGNIDNIKSDSLRKLLALWPTNIAEYKEDEEFHGKFIRERLYPYELKVKPHDAWINDSLFTPFYTRKESEAYYRLLLDDFTYKNMLLRTMMWIEFSVNEGEQLMNDINSIRDLLSKEIKNRQ